jgi:hypothetical protein
MRNNVMKKSDCVLFLALLKEENITSRAPLRTVGGSDVVKMKPAA